MGKNITARYIGNKRVELTHEDSGAKILTDAPKDNQGEGRAFSPTDLFAASLGSCLMTIMAIVAEREGIDLTGMRMEMEKQMAAGPRRIVALPVGIHLPRSIEDKDRKRLENAARACPVHKSLHPDIDAGVEFIYDV